MTEEKTLFGICNGPDNEQSEYVYIKANAQGLRRFANDLNEIADKLETTPGNRIPLTGEENKYNWHISDSFLYYVERIDSIKEYYQEHAPVSKIRETLFKIGCMAALILFFFPFFAGLQTIYNWFF